jgi:hypothetical protein
MSFNDNGYLVIKNFLDKDFLIFIQKYINILIKAGYSKKGDNQSKNSHCFYGDPLIETILDDSCEKISALTNLKLLPTYSYLRLYGKDDELVKHIDRSSCEISATISIAIPDKTKINSIYFSKHEDGRDPIEVLLNPGDICIYRGCSLWHWRKPFIQEWYLQAFLHYVDANGPYKDRIYDKRPYLAIPKYSML